jgi:hypothetical protein
MVGFDTATAVAARDGGGYAAEVHDGWDIAGRANGGYLLAIAAAAGLAVTGRPHPLAVSGHYLASPEPGPVDVSTRLLRSGRSTAVAAVELARGGTLFLSTLVTTGTLTATEAPFHVNTAPPDMPPPGECVRNDGELPGGARINLVDHLEVRFDPASLDWVTKRPTGLPEVRAWVRFCDGRAMDPLALLLIVDGLPPATIPLGVMGWVPTVEMTAYVRGIPAPGWLRAVNRGRLIDGGWMDETSEVWDSAGRLVALGHQLAGVRLPG